MKGTPMTRADLRELLVQVRDLALSPHSRVLDPAPDVALMLTALGLIAGWADRTLDVVARPKPRLVQ